MKRCVQAISFYLLLPWLYVIALLPFTWLYKLADVCFFLAYKVFKYRRKVVWSNLCLVFPDQEAAVLQKLSKDFYQYFCDLVLEHVKTWTITPKQVAERCKLANPSVLQKLYDQSKHIILVTGHYGNWEWAGNAVALQTDYALYALYQPLSNPYFDTLLKRIRTRFHRKIIPQQRALQTMGHYDAAPKATAILADQAPPPKNAYITSFLGQPTHVFKGVEKLAQRLNHAVVYISTQRIRRGHYMVHATLLCDDPASVSPHAITNAYIQQLEAIHLVMVP